jgi:type II secretory pathway predicted ATPase ExeA
MIRSMPRRSPDLSRLPIRMPARRATHAAATDKAGTFAALDQRIALRYAMTGMTDHETSSYVSHYLTLAGRSETFFSDDALSP